MSTKRLLKAVALALDGDWQSAHVIAQEHEGDALADWIHAVVHKMEGDQGNSRYWYRRCGRTPRPEMDVSVERDHPVRGDPRRVPDNTASERRGRPRRVVRRRRACA